MKLIVAKNAGFCFGVARALKAVYKNLKKEERLYSLGPIIHNPQVVSELEEKGVAVLRSPEEAVENSTVIIRSHGVAPDVYEILKAKNVNIIDATCPYVKRIHETVQKYHKMGYDIIIIGEKDHPEVIGISGWADNKCIVVNSPEDVEAIRPSQNPCCIVAQTTTAEEKWDELIQKILKRLPNSEIFCTICSATSNRQREAVRIAKLADTMLVIGGHNSSNTRKLVSICREYCEKTYAVEHIDDIPDIPADDIVGITAGASTPEWLIKEVIYRMNEKISQDETNFAEAMERMFVSIKNGQIVKGTIVLVNSNEICVNIGYKSDGIITLAELDLKPDEDVLTKYHVGDEIEAEVLKVNDGEGNVLLSERRVTAKAAWVKMVRSLENGEIFEAVVRQQVKGGLRAEIDGLTVFIPASHLRLTGVPGDMSRYIGQKLPLKVLEIDRSRKSVVASHKLVLEEEQEKKAEEVWSRIEPGQVLTGTVRRLTDFGAFVDIGGIDGLIHVGNLTWYHVEKASDIVSVGDTVQVVVLNADRERNRISLGMKQLTPKPWDNILEKYHEGDVVTGKVVRIASFGAFVQLEPGVDGLVHISQLAENRVGKVEDVVHVGDVLDFVVLDVKPAEKKISLSLKDAKAKEESGSEISSSAAASDQPAAEPAESVQEESNGEEATE